MESDISYDAQTKAKNKISLFSSQQHGKNLKIIHAINARRMDYFKDLPTSLKITY